MAKIILELTLKWIYNRNFANKGPIKKWDSAMDSSLYPQFGSYLKFEPLDEGLASKSTFCSAMTSNKWPFQSKNFNEAFSEQISGLRGIFCCKYIFYEQFWRNLGMVQRNLCTHNSPYRPFCLIYLRTFFIKYCNLFPH